MTSSSYARYGLLLLEIERLRKEAAALRKQLQVNTSSGKTWGKYRGVRGEVAKELAVSPSTVKSVMQGRSQSARISAAVALAVKKIDDAPRVKKLKPLSNVQLAECERGGRYFGCFNRAAKQSGLSFATIRKAAMGITKSQKPLRALYEEMMRIDALPQAQQREPLIAERLKQFSRGGIYYGHLGHIARELGTSSANLYSVAKGTAKSRRLLEGLHIALERIDAELAGREL